MFINIYHIMNISQLIPQMLMMKIEIVQLVLETQLEEQIGRRLNLNKHRFSLKDKLFKIYVRK